MLVLIPNKVIYVLYIEVKCSQKNPSAVIAMSMQCQCKFIVAKYRNDCIDSTFINTLRARWVVDSG